MEVVLIAFVFCAVIALNITATVAIARDALSERSQKLWQLVLVWLLPIVGAIITLAVHRAPEKPSRQYREPPDPGDDFAYSGRSKNALSELIDGD